MFLPWLGLCTCSSSENQKKKNCWVPLESSLCATVNDPKSSEWTYSALLKFSLDIITAKMSMHFLECSARAAEQLKGLELTITAGKGCSIWSTQYVYPPTLLFIAHPCFHHGLWKTLGLALLSKHKINEVPLHTVSWRNWESHRTSPTKMASESRNQKLSSQLNRNHNPKTY